MLLDTIEGPKPVKSEFVFAMYGQKFHVHRSLKNDTPIWTVSEYMSGTGIGYGKTKKIAIENARRRLNLKGQIAFFKALHKAKILNPEE